MAKLRAAECREFIKAVVEKAEQAGVPVYRRRHDFGKIAASGRPSLSAA